MNFEYEVIEARPKDMTKAVIDALGADGRELRSVVTMPFRLDAYYYFIRTVSPL